MAARKQGAPVRRGSASPSEAYYAARGYRRLSLRLPGDALDMLDQESERSGYSRAELLEEMIRIELDPEHEGYVGAPTIGARKRRAGKGAP
jgi:hypothetical protein